jgi:hypothetical protein
MLCDKDGNKLFRKVLVKVVFPDAIFPDKSFIQHAGPKQGFGPTGIDDILMNIADQLDTLYPFWEFKATEMTPIGRTARFVFTFTGYRATQPAQDKPITDSTTLEPGTAESDLTTEAIKAAVGTTLQDLASQE